MIYRYLIYLLFAGTLLLSGCSRSGDLQDVPVMTAPLRAPDGALENLLGTPYQLHPTDKLTIQVFRVPELSGDYQLDGAGRITLPLVGEVNAAGLTSTEFGNRLEQLYGAQYLRDPSITVSVSEAVGKRFAVEGAVRQAGVFEASPGTTLLRSLALARGTTEEATNRVVILRRIDGAPYAAGFDLALVRRGEQPDPVVFGGDVIVVDTRGPGLDTVDLLRLVPLLTLFERL